MAIAKAFGVRPSSFIDGIASYTAYCFDVAAMIYVSYLEQDKKPLKDSDDALSWL